MHKIYGIVLISGCFLQISLCDSRDRLEHIYTSKHGLVQVYLKTDPLTAYHGGLNTVLLHYQGKIYVLVWGWGDYCCCICKALETCLGDRAPNDRANEGLKHL